MNPYIVRNDVAAEPKEVKHARVPAPWTRILRRLMSLQPGRYQIVLTVQNDDLDWSVMPLGKVEQ